MPACPRCYAVLPEGAIVCPSCRAGIEVPSAAPPPPGRGIPATSAPPSTVGRGGAGTPGGSTSEIPRIALRTGERIVGRFSSSPERQAQVARGNLLPVFVMVIALSTLFAVVILATAPTPRNLYGLLLALPILLFGGLFYSVGRTRPGAQPTTAFVTSQRIIVDRSGPEPGSAVMGLDSLGDVVVVRTGRAARKARVGWVYLLPEGTTRPFVGAGRYRAPAPGVIWIPAVPSEVADQLRATALEATDAFKAARAARTPP